MIRFIISIFAYLIANAVGLLVAVLILPGFTIDAKSFFVAVLIFSVFQSVAGPLITKLSLRKVPQLMGGIALVTILIGLMVTDWLMPGMDIGGISNWLAATLLVWIGALLAGLLLPIYVFKSLRDENQRREDEMEKSIASANAAAASAAASARAAEKAAVSTSNGAK